MKFVKMTAIAAAMAVSFGAQAELSALEDEALAEVTGQSGITIEQSIGGISVAYYDAEGVTGGNANDDNGGVLTLDLATASIVTATGVVAEGDATISMTVDVVDNTPGQAALTGGALAIGQQLLTGTAGAVGALKVDNIKVGGTGDAAASDGTAGAGFAAGYVDATTNAPSIGSVYVTGLDVTMYVYGH